MRKIILALLMSAGMASAYAQDCGVVRIDQFLTGPRHGSMVHVTNTSCGNNGGWICLDPAGDSMPLEESKRMYAFMMMQYALNKQVQLSIYDNVFPVACGGYPGIEDVRSIRQ